MFVIDNDPSDPAVMTFLEYVNPFHAQIYSKNPIICMYVCVCISIYLSIYLENVMVRAY